ncbi:MAG: biotin synthase BioB [Myxococcota bacterium]
MSWRDLAGQVLEGHALSRDEALSVLHCPDDELLALLDATFEVRRAHHGRRVHVHVLENAKSGACPEDCSFCSQSVRYTTDVERYKTETADELVAAAHAAYASGASTYCMVTATRGPSKRDLDTICEAVKRIKAELPISICTSLGVLDGAGAERLVDAGVDRYNHNLETSERYYSELVSTHTWGDRADTLRTAKAAGMQACAGGIIGMGEALEDRVDLALALRELDVESVPVNLLNPRPGTPLGDTEQIRAVDALKALCMFRLVHPDRDVRIAGGREVVLGTMQPFALYAANSLFANGYLTTAGQGESADARMLAEAGFEAVVVGAHAPVDDAAPVFVTRGA